MPATNVHNVHGIDLDGTFVSQLTSVRAQTGTSPVRVAPAGYDTPLFSGVDSQIHQIDFSSPQIATLLGELGFYGVAYSSPVTLFHKKMSNLGRFEAAGSSVHQTIALAESRGCWSTLSARQGGMASLDCMLCPRWDGTNTPFVAAGSQTLSGTSTAAEVYTLGPVLINGTQWEGLEEMTLSLNPEMRKVVADGENWPRHIGLQRLAPMLALRGYRMEGWTDFTAVATPLTALVVYLRRRQSGTVNYSDAASQHIKLTLAGSGTITVDQSSGGETDDAMLGLNITLEPTDASTVPFTIATASAIT